VSQSDPPTKAKAVERDDEALQILALLVFDRLYGSARNSLTIPSVPENDGVDVLSAGTQASEHLAGGVSVQGQSAGVGISNMTPSGASSIESG